MGALTARGRALVVVAFVLAAALCGTAAVALVLASRGDAGPSPRALPSIHPTVLEPSGAGSSPASASPAPTPTPTAGPSPTATPTASATPTPAPTAAATRSAAPRRTAGASPAPAAAAGLTTSAKLNIASGGTTADTYVVSAHATDGKGTIYLDSVDWGDGSQPSPRERGTACSPAARAPADCRDYSVSHRFAQPGSYIVTVTIVSGAESSVLHLDVSVGPTA